MITRKLRLPLLTLHRHVSALYLTGDKAKETFSVLVPHLDFKTKLSDKNKLKANLAKRRHQFDLAAFDEKFELYRELEHRKVALEAKRGEIAQQLRSLNDSELDMIEKLKIDGRIVRDDLKMLKDYNYALEDNFIHQFLKIPNELHSKTPADANDVILSYLDKPNIPDAKSHLDNEELIEYYDEMCYYLRKDAARFNVAMPFHCVDHFIRHNDFIHFSNPDFIRSIVGEAAGFENEEMILVAEETRDQNKVNLLQLAGGGSMLSFLAFIAKLTLYPAALPLKWIADGNQYTPAQNKSLGLYSATQAMAVNAFIATETEAQADEEFQKTLDSLIEYYKQFNLHFTVSYLAADKLTLAESLRASIQMYSPHLKTSLEVANLSRYDDFISKRLLFNIREGKALKFPHIISGTFINVPKLVGIILENNNNCFVYPPFLE